MYIYVYICIYNYIYIYLEVIAWLFAYCLPNRGSVCHIDRGLTVPAWDKADRRMIR